MPTPCRYGGSHDSPAVRRAIALLVHVVVTRCPASTLIPVVHCATTCEECNPGHALVEDLKHRMLHSGRTRQNTRRVSLPIDTDVPMVKCLESRLVQPGQDSLADRGLAATRLPHRGLSLINELLWSGFLRRDYWVAPPQH